VDWNTGRLGLTEIVLSKEQKQNFRQDDERFYVRGSHIQARVSRIKHCGYLHGGIQILEYIQQNEIQIHN
jgi:hypothetical protein